MMHQYHLWQAAHHPQMLFPSFVVFDPASCHGIWPTACPKYPQGKWELRYGETTIQSADGHDTGFQLWADVDMSLGYHMERGQSVVTICMREIELPGRRISWRVH